MDALPLGQAELVLEHQLQDLRQLLAAELVEEDDVVQG